MPQDDAADAAGFLTVLNDYVRKRLLAAEELANVVEDMLNGYANRGSLQAALAAYKEASK